MKRKFVQIAALCLSVMLLTASGGGQSAFAVSSASDTSGTMIRVGLHYGNGAMEGLNLANETGSGFRFGYYDGSDQFVQLGSTQSTAISVVKTMNVYYGTYDGYTSYHSALTSNSVAVGEYHLQLPGTYATYAEAQAAASVYEGGFPAYIDGAFFARIGNYTTRPKAVAAQTALANRGVGTVIKGTSEYGVSVVITGTNTILFQFDDLGKGTGLGVEPNAAGDNPEGVGAYGAQNDGGSGNGKYTTWSHFYLYYGGFRFERIDGGNMTVVNILDLEDYVKGVVPHEMSDSWPLEALKAQAVAARSYAVSLGTKHSGSHFDICYSTHCQAYSGLTRAGSNSDAAVDLTAGQVVLYDGKVAHTYYYSSNGGASESSSNVWPGNQASYPYLLGKEDPYEDAAGINNSYTKIVSSDELVAGLREQGYNEVGTSIVSVAIVSLTESGNPKQVTFTDNNGTQFTINSRLVVKDMLGLRSYRYGIAPGAATMPEVSVNGAPPVDVSGLYAIDGNGNVISVAWDSYVLTGSGTAQLELDIPASTGGGVGNIGSTGTNDGWFTFVGKGWGHNVGMSQYGAKAMAELGYNYLDILQFYYTGITVGSM